MPPAFSQSSLSNLIGPDSKSQQLEKSGRKIQVREDLNLVQRLLYLTFKVSNIDPDTMKQKLLALKRL